VLDDGSHFVMGGPTYSEDCAVYSVRPSEAGYATYPTVTFPDNFIVTSEYNLPGLEVSQIQKLTRDSRYKAALQILLCPSGKIHGKLSGFFPGFKTCASDNCDGCVNITQPKFCGGAIDFVTMDEVFRKVVAAARFQLAKRFLSSISSSCTWHSWDGRTCMNSLMSTADAKCHVVRLPFICLLKDDDSGSCIDYADYNDTHAGPRRANKPHRRVFWPFRILSGGINTLLPAQFMNCMQGGTKQGTCSFSICGSILKFKLGGSSNGRSKWKIQFDGAYQKEKQEYLQGWHTVDWNN